VKVLVTPSGDSR